MTLGAIGPAPVLAFLVGTFHTALFVLLRGSPGGRLPFMWIAAVLGAFAGQALAVHLDDPVRVGDFGLLTASALAWVGILVVAIVGVLGPSTDGG